MRLCGGGTGVPRVPFHRGVRQGLQGVSVETLAAWGYSVLLVLYVSKRVRGQRVKGSKSQTDRPEQTKQD